MIIVEIAGRLGSDPETRFTPGGQKVTNFRVATNVRRKGQDETVWWRVTVWGDRFDKMMQYVKKGSALIIIGEMSPPDIYQNRDGQSQVSLELTAEMIRFSPFGKGDKQEGAAAAPGAPQQQAPQPPAFSGGFTPEPAGGPAGGSMTEDDLPF